MTIHGSVRRGLSRLTLALAANALVWAGVGIGGIAPASAYEVWLTDQSDTAKESGVFSISMTVQRSRRILPLQNRP